MPARSAGILIYRQPAEGTEVLLVHPGGPFWRNKDVGAWQIPKGLVEPGEDDEAAARREAGEELGIQLDGPLTPLGEIRQDGGKTVVAYAAEPLPALPQAVNAALAAGALDAALHYSRRSAALALALADQSGHGGAFRRLRHYCLSADVAFPLEAAGVAVHFVAGRPRETDLLDALAPRLGDGAR